MHRCLLYSGGKWNRIRYTITPGRDRDVTGRVPVNSGFEQTNQCPPRIKLRRTSLLVNILTLMGLGATHRCSVVLCVVWETHVASSNTYLYIKDHLGRGSCRFYFEARCYAVFRSYQFQWKILWLWSVFMCVLSVASTISKSFIYL